MKIQTANNTLGPNSLLSKRNSCNNNHLYEKHDSFSRAERLSLPVHFESGKNYIKVVSFTGLKNPVSALKPALQMRVTGVTRFQDNMDPQKIKDHLLFNINRLADSKWKDGDPINFVIEEGNKAMIQLFSPKHGRLGRVPDEIAPSIVKLLEKNPKDFKFELSNIVAGSTKGAPTIGLRVNLRYHGKNPEKAQAAFTEVLNNPNAAEKVFLYQPVKSPNDILKEILDYETHINGPKAAEQMEKSISNISKEIDSPENKKILYIGHCKPDGDTLGCILGLNNATKMVHPQKMVDCAVDDEVTGLFRHKLPGIDDNVKHPYSERKIALLKEELSSLLKNSGDKAEINKVRTALANARNPRLTLDPKEKYDLVVLLDVPSPARFSDGFKDYIKNAKKVIYIDHHPLKQEEWQKAVEKTGLDMNEIIKNNLAWIAERVPAATQQATIIASKLLPERNPLNPDNIVKTINSKKRNPQLNATVASFVTGMWTDTGGFGRTANLLPEDIVDKLGKHVPIQDRPNFWPEGLSKWLFKLTNGDIDKKWMREELTYDINDEKISTKLLSARDKMVECAKKNQYENKNIGLGSLTASFDEQQEILKFAQIKEPETSLLDVQNAFKYSEIMNDFRNSSKAGAPIGERSKKVVIGPYDKDKIAVFVCESEKVGTINTEGKKSLNNALRFSFRSKEGTIHAELLALLFNGGGHGNAAGGGLVGKDITLNSTFNAIIGGKKAVNPEKIYAALIKNYEIMNNKDLSTLEKETAKLKIELVQDEKGKKPVELIEEVVKRIRAHEDKPLGRNNK